MISEFKDLVVRAVVCVRMQVRVAWGLAYFGAGPMGVLVKRPRETVAVAVPITRFPCLIVTLICHLFPARPANPPVGATYECWT